MDWMTRLQAADWLAARDADEDTPGDPAATCGLPIDAAIVGPCERPAGHAGPCRAYSLEGQDPATYIATPQGPVDVSGYTADAYGSRGDGPDVCEHGYAHGCRACDPDGPSTVADVPDDDLPF
jgi:hypothetical protein